MDPLRDEVLMEIARKGRCHWNEAISMAEELIRLRAERNKPPEPVEDLYMATYNWATP